MLEVRNLTKIYKDKGGTEVHALDNVSVKLGDTGLVFVLGKSGCGKSTFLNMVGGLDMPTSGEIIINGKSSKDFSQADFDSYRNTFIGFVFQEYNVLNEFTVEDNVALALNLQKQKQIKDKVMEILKEVELDKYAKRKPNTLSGGQKQRIAIARALVKDPQIIMADEPTGALDSNTGRQVLDTLKHLSKTRLVIVVSHDRDFAEEYGDRIIELSDGRVIADITKVYEQPVSVGGSVQQIGSEILTIEKGAQLTQQNYLAIQRFISTHNGVMIVSGDKEIANTKKANRISDNNSREAFQETYRTGYGAYLNNAKPKNMDDKLIRSSLPMGKAIKMGASGLKGHPIRLLLTILLSVIAFIVFGILTCFMTYNGTAVAASSFADGNGNYFKLNKSYAQYSTYTYYQEDRTYSSTSYESTYFSPDDAEYFGYEASDVVFGCAYYSNFRYADLDTSSENASIGSYYTMGQIDMALYVPEGNDLRENMIGNYPKSDDEMALSNYLADYLMHCQIYTTYSSDPYKHEKQEDLIGLQLELNDGKTMTVTGIINS